MNNWVDDLHDDRLHLHDGSSLSAALSSTRAAPRDDPSKALGRAPMRDCGPRPPSVLHHDPIKIKQCCDPHLVHPAEARAPWLSALLPFFGPPDVRVFPALFRWRAGHAFVILQRNRGLIPDCPVRAHLIVVLAPILHFRAGVVKMLGTSRVQALGPETPVEGFDERVVGRLFRT